MSSTIPAHVYEIRPRLDKRGVDLISDVLPFGRLWYAEPNAISSPAPQDRARIVFDCQKANDPASMSSTTPARFTAHGAL